MGNLCIILIINIIIRCKLILRYMRVRVCAQYSSARTRAHVLTARAPVTIETLTIALPPANVCRISSITIARKLCGFRSLDTAIKKLGNKKYGGSSPVENSRVRVGGS